MWAVLGADQGEKWPWLEREGDLGSLSGRSWERIKAKSSPGSSGKAIWAAGRAVLGADQGEKWP